MQNYIKSINWVTCVQLRDKYLYFYYNFYRKIEYVNEHGVFKNTHPVKATIRNRNERRLIAKDILIAVRAIQISQGINIIAYLVMTFFH